MRALPLLLLSALGCTRGDDTGAEPARGPLAVGALEFAEAPRNLLVIGVDTLRRDRAGRYGDRDLTPAQDGIFSGAVALDQHRSCSNWTFSASLCMSAGQSQLAMGFAPSQSEPIPGEITLLAQRLRGAGYATGLVSANTFLGPDTDYDRGFDSALVPEVPRSAQVITDEGARALDEMIAGGDPWFLQLHYMEPHDPYRPDGDPTAELDPIDFDPTDAESWDTLQRLWGGLDDAERALIVQHLEALYDAEVQAWDDGLAALFVHLRTTPGALEDTLVVLWSDHGEQFDERGSLTHGHGVHAEENLAIAAFWTLPADAGGPGLAPLAWRGVTTHADLTPTILAALGQPVPDEMTGAVVGEAPDDRAVSALRYHAAHPDGTDHVIERDGWRLHYAWSGELALYDLASDPAELTDRFDPDDERARALWADLEPQVRSLVELGGAEDPVWPDWP